MTNKTTKDPNSNGDNTERDGKGRFIKGNSAIGAGRPKGRISIKTKIVEYLTKNPEKMEELVNFYLEDKKMRDLLWKMIDGMPKQQTELSGEVGAIYTYKIMGANETTETSEGI